MKLTQEELTLKNLGQNLDNLMNLDPRGYGVCRILYEGSRKYTGKATSINAAEQLVKVIKEGDLVYILTGFVLLPHKKAEMDGIVGAMLLSRAISKAFKAKPVIICPEDNLVAVENMAYTMGLHLYHSIDEVKQYPISMAVIPFTKDFAKAQAQAEEIISHGMPSMVISTEAPSSNEKGVFHNATGLNLTQLQAKSEVLFELLQSKGVPNIAIGDLGNEIGMGSIKEHIKKYIPYAREGACRCGCGGGLLAKTKAQHIITATVSDWGVNALIAAVAYLKGDIDILHTSDIQQQAMQVASKSGMVDMYGDLIPAIDGFGITMNVSILELMRQCVIETMKLKETCATWFEKVIELEYFEEQ